MNKWKPKDRERCWLAQPSSLALVSKQTFWKGALWHEEMLKRGVLYKTKRQAVAAAKKMIRSVSTERNG